MITCKEYAKIYKENLKERIKNMDRAPSLTVVQVGNNPASNKYVAGKKRDCEEVGIDCEIIKLPETVSTEELIALVKNCNSDGIIVQLPLPTSINKDAVIEAIPKEKDVDGFVSGSNFTPCTPKGIMMYLKSIFNNEFFEGKNAVVIGRSDIVGKPIAELLLKENCTVTTCHSHTRDLKSFCKRADIIVVAVGHENILTMDMIDIQKKPVVIDVGINVDSDGKLHGDCDYDDLKEHCSLITPVPGGVGLLTRCGLLDNVVRARKEADKCDC